jgi:hypothetical protein
VGNTLLSSKPRHRESSKTHDKSVAFHLQDGAPTEKRSYVLIEWRCTRVNWNIGISIAIAVLVFITSALGGQLASTKVWHKWVFWGFGFAAWVLISIQAVINEHTQSSLQTQLDKIQHNTEQPQQPPNVTFNPHINMPVPNQHTRVSWATPWEVQPGPGSPTHVDPLWLLLPFRKGETPTLNVGFKNDGEFPVLSAKSKVIIVIAPFGGRYTIFRDNKKKLNAASSVPGGVIDPHQHVVRYNTYRGTPLTDDDVAKLTTAHGSALCVLGIVSWKDSTGKYETDLAQCFTAETPQPDAGFNWHILEENDAEHKLK